MHLSILVAACCCLVPYIAAENASPSSPEDPSAILDRSLVQAENEEGGRGGTLNRQKRTLLLKKKLIGAGLLGFGLGLAKGYKAGYYTAPQVRHVYLSPPPPPPPPSVKYIEYVEKPIYVERIVESSPVSLLKPTHVQYKDPSTYGSW